MGSDSAWVARAVVTNVVLGVLSLLGGGCQTMFDTLNRRPFSYPVFVLAGLGVGLLAMAPLISRRVRVAAWLSLLLVIALATLANYWAFHNGVSWPEGGFLRALAHALKGGLVILFIEGLLIWAIVVEWNAQGAIGEASARRARP